MLDLIHQRRATAAAVLELSSFQLEFNKTWAPDVALWINCFANHLDRHTTMAAYVNAKLNLLRHQTKHQIALLSASLLQGEAGAWVTPALAALKSQVYLVSINPDDRRLVSCIPRAPVAFITVDGGQVVIEQVADGQVTTVHQVCSINDLPAVTFTDNWLHVLGALYAMGIDPQAIGTWLKVHKDTIAIDNEHRCEFVATVNGVDFYNDSKATVIQSTAAAVDRLATQQRPLILILGGLGKGVDRSPLLATLKTIKNIKKIYCFGKECAAFAPAATCYSTLEDVMAAVNKLMAPGDLVLLSPSGSSYDLYKNYEERGLEFKKFVTQLK
jgi:UDP-N-acetylmuramoylalanine--D-glutamate ligase